VLREAQRKKEKEGRKKRKRRYPGERRERKDPCNVFGTRRSAVDEVSRNI